MKSLKVRQQSSLLAVGLLAVTCSATALETDQFYAWGQPIEESADYLNAWVKLELQSVLDTIDPASPVDCEGAVKHVQTLLQQTIYHRFEMWSVSSALVDRIPRGLEEERDYREHYLLADTVPIDVARWLPPSPTLQVNGVRIGSDKLSHFFSQGWWYYQWWHEHADELTPDELQSEMIRYGIRVEWALLGMMPTGIFSPADLEANYQGFLFYQNMCRGSDSLLHRNQGRWTFSQAFDFRDYVTPEWDESWQPNIYSDRRWKWIQPAVASYCPAWHSPWVKQQRKRYRQLDQQTPTEDLIAELVAAGELPDPQQFDIAFICR